MDINRYTHENCKHRWSMVKRWQENNEYYAIIRCRWCDKWTRKTIALDTKSQKPTMKTVLIVDDLDTETGSPKEPKAKDAS